MSSHTMEFRFKIQNCFSISQLVDAKKMTPKAELSLKQFLTSKTTVSPQSIYLHLSTNKLSTYLNGIDDNTLQSISIK